MLQFLKIKNIFSLLFVAAFVVFLFPISAHASTTITTCQELQNMNNNLAENYVLGNDIDCSATSTWNAGAGFLPVGRNSPFFTGTFDGQNHTINNLFINRPANDSIGLFGVIDSGSAISNVGLINVNIAGNSDVGGLVGYNNGNGGTTISNSYVTGVVSGQNTIGALVGTNYTSGTISNSHATANVSTVSYAGGLVGGNNGLISNSYATGNVTATNHDAGGLVGILYGTISNSYATGTVTGNDDIGGLAAENQGGTISNSYATGSVIENNASRNGGEIGGLVGANFSGGTITNSYSTGLVDSGDPSNDSGGLIGSNSSTVTTSFWDTTTSGFATSDGGTGKATADMKTQSTFTGVTWNFTTVWNNDTGLIRNSGYPYLRWQTFPAVTTTGGGYYCPTGASFESLPKECITAFNTTVGNAPAFVPPTTVGSANPLSLNQQDLITYVGSVIQQLTSLVSIRPASIPIILKLLPLLQQLLGAS